MKSLSIDIKSDLNNFGMDISLKTKAKRIGILGASGAGKSMLLKYISGIISPDQGRIEINGETIFDSSRKIDVIPQKRDVAYMFQNYALFPNMTVRENIEVVLSGSKEYKRDKADRYMKKFCIDNLEDKMPRNLSGGQQQRVALARIMAYEPKLILLDEPFSALDNDLKDKLQIELEDMLSDYEGMVIMVSHSRDEIYRFSDELIIIHNGMVVEQGKTKEVFSRPKTFEGAKMVGVTNILPVEVDQDSSIKIPDLDIRITRDDYERLDVKDRIIDFVEFKNKIKYIGVRDRDFKIVYSQSIDKNNKDVEESSFILVAKVERIYEGLDMTSVYFSVQNRFDKSKIVKKPQKNYCIKINRLENKNNLFVNALISISIDKEKLIFIEN
ncbi:sulfate/molybdate ABC transporter ATP-binding protein [Peptostreptococcus anaerobius]|uniref:sulfate/molybdate ABC transporter ATP-binding protein n=1 Tax=Peptostreptococcus anaerobius TaxID=1261 RepID=UPI001D0998BD|nr:ATP-binding cassette domain-containing protein [Peptostreptococcus anaerobius]MCB6982202.1 ATP-binding cassette domain-containing protein [Peptostreptococcus anaerobius]MCQ5150307.1 ATP-binding cassette domain-containing protein [Peptostreptococcus anaerobius]MDU1175777.1 ATP-binding cassette domain-containing protein [Peptostreptococcus anaerobius]MDU1234257.1 ATP-binding cassette domain-containing protein [Peptostreptococcus anaerobius]